MTREEFESILEEAFLEGYNNAIDEIEEILDEDYIDIEDDYGYYTESNAAARARKKEIIARNLGTEYQGDYMIKGRKDTSTDYDSRARRKYGGTWSAEELHKRRMDVLNKVKNGKKANLMDHKFFKGKYSPILDKAKEEK